MKLKKGDTIDIVAPSSFPVNEDWLKGLKILEGWHLKTRFPKNMISPWLYHANTNKKRIKFLKQAFKNSTSQAVWALRGGYGLQKVMPFFEKNKLQKKMFIGFSDATALHLYLNSVCKIPSLHAPFVSDLPYLSQKNLKILRSILFGEQEEVVFSDLELLQKNLKIKKLKSFIIGGNLTLLSSSLSSGWFPKNLGSCFLFLEDVNEEDYRVDRALHQLFFSGAIKKVKAILLGSFLPLKKKNLKNKLLKSFSDFSNIPIVMGLPCGHDVKNNNPLPLAKNSEISFQGSKATLRIKSF